MVARYLALLAVVSALNGCAGAPLGEQWGKELAQLKERIWQREDTAQADFVANARGVVSWRTPALKPYTKTMQALQNACSKNVTVEVFVASEAKQEIPRLSSCVKFYVTTHPDVVKQGSFVLVDSDQAMLRGKQEWLPSKIHAQELLFRQQLRMTASMQ